MIAAETPSEETFSASRSMGWLGLLKLPQTWGTIVSKTLTDPVWFFITDWFPIYLLAKGISHRSGLFALWIPFIAADLGNFFGGFASGFLIKRGWPLGAARKALVVFGGIGVTLLIPTIATTNLFAIAMFFALATFCYAAFSTIANVFPSDLYHGNSVASVSGMSGMGAGIGTIIATQLIGRYSDANQALGSHRKRACPADLSERIVFAIVPVNRLWKKRKSARVKGNKTKLPAILENSACSAKNAAAKPWNFCERKDEF